jgi:large subunit ribosomal protein L31
MKKDIHPESYDFITVTLADGTEIKTRSTMNGEYKSEVDSTNHPFYTGKRQFVDTTGRVEKFRRRYGMQAKQETEQETEEA